MQAKQPMTPFWLVGWAVALALGWLLPNHYLPWTSFHVDAWVGFMLLLAAAGVMLRTARSVAWHGMTVLMAVLLFMPLLQYGLGLVAFSGTAWVSSAYLIGFLLALLTGAQWESARSGQLADGLFLAIGVASIVSVGLQLHQWLELGLLDVWAIGNTSGRPFANLGQPNELGTLLLWGLLAIAWGVVRQRLGAWTALFIAVYLLFGLALTQSRTAWLALVLLVGASWFWRRWGSNHRWPWFVTGLGLYFAVCVIVLGWLGQALLLTSASVVTDIVRITGELRPQLWSMFIDAALQQPWFGYGWNQVGLAQLAVASDHPPLYMAAFHSHNLFLDFMLWCGIPVGLFVSFYLLRWLWLCLRAVQGAEEALLVLFLLVVFNHAMLELPLHHAYFLLPTGLVVGALNVRLNFQPMLSLGRKSVWVILFCSAALLALIVRDYLRVEISYLALRFEWAHVKTETRGTPPEVVVLNQLGEFIRFARIEPDRGMTPSDLDWMRKVTSTYPNTGAIYKLATALAMNQQPKEAQRWLMRMCKIVPEAECAAVKDVWISKSRSNPDISAVSWPN
jgi:O-antigen ligase